MEFTTKVSVDVYGSGKDDIRTSDAKLIWELDLELRSNGVKNIYITPKFLGFDMEWIENIHHDLDRDIWEEKEMYESFEIDLLKDGWTVSEEITTDGEIYPDFVELDFDAKTIKITS
jgi:hypothetical protein